MSLKIYSCHWRGWRKDTYTTEHFNILKRMLKDNLTIDHELIVISDDPYNKGYEMPVIPMLYDEKLIIRGKEGKPNCFTRLKLFDNRTVRHFGEVGEHIISIDVDIVVMGNLDHLFKEKFKFKSLKGLYVPYSCGMVMYQLGSMPELYDEFNPDKHPQMVLRNVNQETGQRYAGSDQAYISHYLKNSDCPRWSTQDGCYSTTWDRSRFNNGKIPENCCIIQTPGSRKPTNALLKTFNEKIFFEYEKYNQNKQENNLVDFVIKRNSIYGKKGTTIQLNDIQKIENLKNRQII